MGNGQYGWELKGSKINGGDSFGGSVSLGMNGNLVAIGEIFRNGINGVDVGVVKNFEFDSTTNEWIELGSNIDLTIKKLVFQYICEKKKNQIMLIKTEKNVDSLNRYPSNVFIDLCKARL